MVGSSQPDPKSTIKFLCSYAGKILPRHPDGKLRYVGGHTRVLAVNRTIPFAELLLKLEELCGTSVRQLRCQLPAEDLDALVSISSDEDLANLIEEYDHAPSPSLKVRVFLSPPRSLNKVSMPPSPSLSKSTSSTSSTSSSTSSSSSHHSATGGGSGLNSGRSLKSVAPVINRCVHQISAAAAYPVGVEKKSSGIQRIIPHPRYGYHIQGQGKTCHAGHIYLTHNNNNHWQ
ncbi:hypothetical protein TanjilG_20713 [Lupinus angustifolius]|uniref:PB1 domain-containing protein n=1 Tax=Lupinus angustifolius TaxID=3871 RepID=A0A4P1QRL8_LUPAN|nr:PREDICTED: uncharacterized protein LOC109332173 [Lupinus angustifolius]XP_019422586.1 PREDICTED: uncharacterized protein LOC109332173 [Lupinus angustifolius]XP_019422587.1 PREDICTED: uncharacterized protein LOC109332173 [Lupinus angustifolius]XP_019422588.1 PREDICTED: uncharacterized protein LOC109332173 [Lupinus angustifolius]XP_019422589.1 PREDICTED: uncharacterized protein LOC109332173 [Lupinus angustifolius]XP_019422590.1 PREDICTED: uncharacterized protein LOC109332173 [Lupinus angustif